MVTERFTDEERQRLEIMVMTYMNVRLGQPRTEDLRILSLISGTDTVLIAERAYPAKKTGQ